MTNKSPVVIAAEGMQDVFGRLWARWQDEREYEDIAEYRNALEKVAAKYSASVIRMTKRPFAVFFTVKGSQVPNTIFVMSMGKRAVELKRA